MCRTIQRRLPLWPNIVAICALACACVVPAKAFPQEDDLKRELLAQAPVKWRQYLAKAKQLQGSIRVTSAWFNTWKPGEYHQRNSREVEIRQSPEAALIK